MGLDKSDTGHSKHGQRRWGDSDKPFGAAMVHQVICLILITVFVSAVSGFFRDSGRMFADRKRGRNPLVVDKSEPSFCCP